VTFGEVTGKFCIEYTSKRASNRPNPSLFPGYKISIIWATFYDFQTCHMQIWVYQLIKIILQIPSSLCQHKTILQILTSSCQHKKYYKYRHCVNIKQYYKYRHHHVSIKQYYKYRHHHVNIKQYYKYRHHHVNIKNITNTVIIVST
jgi:hypothetical protein